MNVANLTQQLTAFLSGCSDKAGSGNVVLDMAVLVALVGLAAAVLVIFAWVQARRISALQQFSPLSGLSGRLEKVERNLNDFRTETMRSVEIFKREAGWIKQEIQELRGSVRGGKGGGGEGGGQSTGGAEGEGGPGAGEDILDFSAGEEVDEAPEAEPPGDRAGNLTARLSRTRAGLLGRIKNLFIGKPQLDRDMLEELEALLVCNDLGVKLVGELIARVEQEIEKGERLGQGDVIERLKEKVRGILKHAAPAAAGIPAQRRDDGPLVVMVVGVNGVGKTTTVAKLAGAWKAAGLKVMMVAGDTFRAAAVQQLREWGERVGVPVVAATD